MDFWHIERAELVGSDWIEHEWKEAIKYARGGGGNKPAMGKIKRIVDDIRRNMECRGKKTKLNGVRVHIIDHKL